MKSRRLTHCELLVLAMLKEMPRHGYLIEDEIKARNIRSWFRISRSHIYNCLGKFQRMGLVTFVPSDNPYLEKKNRRCLRLTRSGRRALDKALKAMGERENPPLHPLQDLQWFGLSLLSGYAFEKKKQRARRQKIDKLLSEKAGELRWMRARDSFGYPILPSVLESEIRHLEREKNWLMLHTGRAQKATYRLIFA